MTGEITCVICGITLKNAPIVVTVKYPKEEEFEVCSENCGITFFKKRKIDIEAFKKGE